MPNQIHMQRFLFEQPVEISADAFLLLPEEKRPLVLTGMVWERGERGKMDRGYPMICVRMDAPFPGGHTLPATTFRCEPGHGWYSRREYVRPIKNEA
jgi:hypothetical protein